MVSVVVAGAVVKEKVELGVSESLVLVKYIRKELTGSPVRGSLCSCCTCSCRS